MSKEMPNPKRQRLARDARAENRNRMRVATEAAQAAQAATQTQEVQTIVNVENNINNAVDNLPLIPDNVIEIVIQIEENIANSLVSSQRNDQQLSNLTQALGVAGGYISATATTAAAAATALRNSISRISINNIPAVSGYINTLFRPTAEGLQLVAQATAGRAREITQASVQVVQGTQATLRRGVQELQSVAVQTAQTAQELATDVINTVLGGVNMGINIAGNEFTTAALVSSFTIEQLLQLVRRGLLEPVQDGMDQGGSKRRKSRKSKNSKKSKKSRKSKRRRTHRRK